MRIRVALPLGLALASASCDPSGPFGGDGDAVPLTAIVTSGDTLYHAGVAFTFDHTPIGPVARIEVLIEGVPTFVVDSAWTAGVGDTAPVVVPARTPNGERTFRLRATGVNGQVGVAEFTRVIHVPDVFYSAEVITADSYDPRPTAMNATGEVVGTVYGNPSSFTPVGAFHWRTGSLRMLPPLAGASYSTAASINDAGDIVGLSMLPGPHTFTRATHWREDGVAAVLVGTDTASAATYVDNDRRALTVGGSRTRFVSLESGETVDGPHVVVMTSANNSLQAIGTGFGMYESVIVTTPGVTVTLPPGLPGRHERFGRGIYYVGYGLANDGSVLGARHGEVFLSRAGDVEYVAPRILTARPNPSSSKGGPRLTPGGDIVALAGKDSLFVYRPDVGTHRVRLSQPGIELDDAITINAAGQILAHGLQAATGKGVALVLTPVSTP